MVGPSRGGKNIACALPELPNAEVLDLDAEGADKFGPGSSGEGGWEGRWQRNAALLIAAEQRSRETDLLVDVGAGSLQTSQGRRFFIERGPHSIAVVATWDVVLSRHPPGRDPQEFRNTEYSEERQAVYRAAGHQVDSSLTIQESEMMFRGALHLLLDGGRRE